MRPFLTMSSGLCAMSLVTIAAAGSPRYVVDVPTGARVSMQQPVASAKTLLMRSAAIPQHVQLSLDRERVIGAMRVLRFRQVHQGVPVFDRGAAITYDASGVSRMATSKIEPRLPASVTPAISKTEAIEAASRASGLNATTTQTRLLIWPTPQGGRLAYSVLPPSLLPIPYAPVIIVDAMNGQILAKHNLVRFKNLANVHEFNPVSTPDTIEVTLPIDDPHTAPQNELLVSYNCVDTKTTKTVSFSGIPITVHVCEMQQNAQADTDTGDYTAYALEDHTSGGDPHAQIAIFYHAAKAYAYFKGFDPDFELEGGSKPLFLIANLMLPPGLMDGDFAKMSDVNEPLEPFPNAMSVGWDPMFGDLMSSIWPEITGGTLMLGQGSVVDYSYDGDVVYHEFGHSVVGSTIGTMGYWHLDAQGATAAPGAMNEALADFFSSAITSDPAAGEYSAQETGDAQIRHLENANVCPTHLTGEVHYDSEFFSAALWAARSALSTDDDRFAFDNAIFTALNTAASGDVGFEELAEAFVASVASSALGQSVADALEAEFTSRGVLPSCDRTFVYDGAPIASQADSMYNHFLSAGKGMFFNSGSLPYAPGTFQVQVPVPAGATEMKVVFSELIAGGGMSMPFGQGTEFAPAFIVSWDEPISFDWNANTSNAADPVPMSKFNTYWSASHDVSDGAQTAYVMIVNQGDQDGYLTDLRFDFPEDPDAGTEPIEPQPDAGTDAGMDAGVQPTEPGSSPSDSDDDGCGCRTAPTGGSGLGMAAVLGIVGLGIARRRRRGTMPS